MFAALPPSPTPSPHSSLFLPLFLASLKNKLRLIIVALEIRACYSCLLACMSHIFIHVLPFFSRKKKKLRQLAKVHNSKWNRNEGVGEKKKLVERGKSVQKKKRKAQGWPTRRMPRGPAPCGRSVTHVARRLLVGLMPRFPGTVRCETHSWRGRSHTELGVDAGETFPLRVLTKGTW